MQEHEANAILDEEIGAEGRLSENQELMLYNMSLRQTSQRAAGGREGTHMLLAKIEGDPVYQEMIERGLLECKFYGQGGADMAAVTLLVTRKGLRYCVMHAAEIEPRRAYDVAGAQRAHTDFERKVAASDDVNYAAVTSGVASGVSAAKDAAGALSAEQVARFEEIGAKRRGWEPEGAGCAPASPTYWSKTVPGDGRGDYLLTITPDMTFTGFSVDSVTVGLSRDQIERFAKIREQRKASGIRRRTLRAGFQAVSGRFDFISESGDVWTYVQDGGSVAQIVGVSSVSKTLRVPSQVDGATVVAIAADALSMNDVVEEIICPDSVGVIGARAFGLNPKLRRLVLPSGVDEFQPSWITRCPNLEELVLPGLIEEVTKGVFESKQLRKLVIGIGVHTVQPGAFQDTCLDSIEVDEGNPFIETDGIAVYVKGGEELLALARPVESLVVAQGCKRLARKCCCGFAQLGKVELPNSLVEIGPFAFSRSGVERFAAPASLRVIGEKAFYGCATLEHVTLNDGLETIGDSAFEGSAIAELEIPATIKRLGKSMTKGTGVVHSGPGCTLTIDEGCTDLLLDGEGGLYRMHEDGMHLVQLVDGELTRYNVKDGAVAIDDYAFAYHDNIGTVRVAQSVRSIGRSAFRVCKSLRHVIVPDTVESIGDEAFLDTNLEEFRVPAALTVLGERALVTYGAHHGSKMPSLAHVEVAPGNDVFYVVCGMLCRKEKSGASVVVFTSAKPRVELPGEITRIEEYAFSNARGIEYLALGPRLSTIGTNGLSTRCWIRQIHVELDKPLANRRVFDFFFPDTPGAVRGIALGLGGASWVNVPGIMEQLDLCLVNARDYNAPGKKGNISAYAQAKLILDRLDDPVMLTSHKKTMMERVLRNNIEDICVDVALYDDRTVLGELVDRGFVNADNLDGVIERVTALRDAATSAFLLETKRQRFSRAVSDYDL